MRQVKNLTLKQKSFCAAYVRSDSPTEAYREAYDTSRMKPDTVRYAARNLLKKNHVATTVEMLKRDREERLRKKYEVTEERIIAELVRIGFFNVKDTFDENGFLKPLSEQDDDVTGALGEVIISESIDGETLTRVTKIKPLDKLSALKELAKMLQIFKGDNDQKAPQGSQTVNNTFNLIEHLGSLYPDPEDRRPGLAGDD